MSEGAVTAASRRRSVRYRLLAIALVPMLVILPLLLGISIYRWNARFDALAVSKVNDDLTIAHQYMARIRETMEGQLVSLGDSARFHELLLQGGYADGALAAFLRETAAGRRLDFL